MRMLSFVDKKNSNFAKDKFWKTLLTLSLVTYFCVGILIHKDYGMSCDEMTERYTGIVNASHVVSKLSSDLSQKLTTKAESKNFHIEPIGTYRDRHYGFVVQFALLLSDLYTGLEAPSQEIWNNRHLTLFLVYFLGIVFFFKLCRFHFSLKVSVLVTILLICTPRFFAEAFYNPKDIPLFTSFIISSYLCLRFLKNPNWANLIIFTLAIGLSSGIRVIGAYLLPVGLLLFW